MAKTYSYAHRQRRKALLASMKDGVTLCLHCHKPMYRSQALDLGHVIDLALGGDMNGVSYLAHAYCNRRAGQLLSSQRRRKPGYKPAKSKPRLPKW